MCSSGESRGNTDVTSHESSPLMKKTTDRERRRDDDEETKDGGYGWVVVAASFLCNMVLDGISYSFGMLLEPIKKDFNSGSASVSLVGSILAGMILLTGPVSAFCCNKFGTRLTCALGAVLSGLAIFCSSFSQSIPVLIVSYGVLGGVGLGLMYVPSVVCVSQYFNKRLSLATGICVCGSGAGTFVFAPLTAKLVDLYGWRGCNRIISAFCLLCSLLGLLMVPRHERTTEQTKFNVGILKKPAFILFMLGNIPTVMATYATYTYLPVMANHIGLSADKSSFLISAVGITNTVGRILCGWLTDLPWVNPIVLTSVGTALAGVLPALMMFCGNYAEFLTTSAMFGLFLSVVPTATSAVLVDLLGLGNLNTAFGMLTFARGLAALIGPPIAGALLDSTGQYSVSFFASAGELALAGLIALSVYSLHRRTQAANQYETLA